MERSKIRELLENESGRSVDERLDEIMGMNGKDVNNAKSPIADLRAKLDAANGELDGLRQKQSEQMTQEERLQALLKEVEQQKVDNAIESNRIKAESILSGIGLTGEEASGQLDLLVSEDTEATLQRAQAFADLITAQRDATKAATEKAMLSKMGHPGGDGHDNEVTKEAFSKMTYSQKLEIKQSDPELFKKLSS